MAEVFFQDFVMWWGLVNLPSFLITLYTIFSSSQQHNNTNFFVASESQLNWKSKEGMSSFLGRHQNQYARQFLRKQAHVKENIYLMNCVLLPHWQYILYTAVDQVTLNKSASQFAKCSILFQCFSVLCMLSNDPVKHTFHIFSSFDIITNHEK